jgi:hypothetical protein
VEIKPEGEGLLEKTEFFTCAPPPSRTVRGKRPKNLEELDQDAKAFEQVLAHIIPMLKLEYTSTNIKSNL